MKIDFIKKLSNCRVEGTQLPFFPEMVEGYTEQEIDLIARNCNLDIHGQFREFLLQMGKCSGGLIWGWDFTMYNPYWNPLDFQLFQQNEQKDENYTIDIDMINPIEKKMFYLHSENELNSFYYLLTDNDDDSVWAYDDGSNILKNTNLSLLEQLIHYVKYKNKASRFIDFNLTNEQISKYTEGRLL